MYRISLIFALSMCLIPVLAHASDCPTSVRYEIGDVREKSPIKLVQNVSIAPEHFTRSDLLCLGKELEKRYVANRREVYISIFDDHFAAMRRPAIPIEARPRDYEIYQHEHAAYVFDRNQGQNYVVLEPDVWDTSGHARLPIDSNGSSDCVIRIDQDRCLMIIASHLRYPERAWRSSETGSVAVEATVAKDGVVTEAKGTAMEGQTGAELLIARAMEHARSWRFEPGPEVSTINVVFIFQLTTSSDVAPRESLRYSLPERVVISANAAR